MGSPRPPNSTLRPLYWKPYLLSNTEHRHWLTQHGHHLPRARTEPAWLWITVPRHMVLPEQLPCHATSQTHKDTIS